MGKTMEWRTIMGGGGGARGEAESGVEGDSSPPNAST